MLSIMSPLSHLPLNNNIMHPIRGHVRKSSQPLAWFKPRPRRLLLLGTLIFAFLVFIWSAYRIGALSVGFDTSITDNKSQRPFLPNASVFGNTDVSIRSRDFVIGETRARNLQCLGWWTSHDEGRFQGKQMSAFHPNCSELVSNAIKSGYCEVQDVDSKEIFRVMRRRCNSLRKGARFRCQDAPAFVNFRVQADKTIRAALHSSFRLPHVNLTKDANTRDGIVMVVYPKLVASAYATIRVLRNVLQCQLPIEIWFRPDEVKEAHRKSLDPLRYLAATEGHITFQEIHDRRAKRFRAKIHAIYHSEFDRVLFLDADNVPVRDPSFLFESREFLKTGAIFWPDFWHPGHSIFGINENSLLWELLDMPFVNMFEQESGQLVIDRRRHAAPLELVRFYAQYRPDFFSLLKLAWGDKDLFRFAWLKLDIPFTMIQTPPGMAGIVSDGFVRSDFCGMTMVQHDADGEILFMHRNQHKLLGKVADSVEEEASSHETNIDVIDVAPDAVETYADPSIWKHLLVFHKELSRRYYAVDKFRTDLDLQANHPCFGLRDVYRNPHFYLQEIAASNFSRLESQLQHFALESVRFSSKTPSV